MSFPSELLALVALVLFLLPGAYIAFLELRVIALESDLPAANAPTIAHYTILLGEHEALQGAYKTSQTTIFALRVTINSLEKALLAAERLAHPCNHDGAFTAMQQSISVLQQQLASAEGQLARNKIIWDDKSARIRELQGRVDTAGCAQSKMDRLEAIINYQKILLFKRKAVCDQYDYVKELIYRMVAAGGHMMVVSILFVGMLAHFGGVDLAGLGIDHLRFQTYFDYAVAMADGLPCALLPQGMSS
jgi:hypothetical protein